MTANVRVRLGRIDGEYLDCINDLQDFLDPGPTWNVQENVGAGLNVWHGGVGFAQRDCAENIDLRQGCAVLVSGLEASPNGTGPKYRKIGGRVVNALDELNAWADIGAKTSMSDPGVGTVRPAKRNAVARTAMNNPYLNYWHDRGTQSAAMSASIVDLARRHNENSEVLWSGYKLKLYRGGSVYLLSVRTRRSPPIPRRVYAFILSFERAREAAIWMR